MDTTQDDFSIYRIEAGDGTASAEVVPELGAIVSSLKLPWKNEQREVLFAHPFFWDRAAERTRGGLPFLFPCCGRMERDGVGGAYLYAGQRYEIKIHGFSMRMPWKVDEAGRDSLTVTLTDTDVTRAVYPFAFRVSLTFKVGAGRLRLEQKYENTGKHPMPYYAGFHPYFLTPPVEGGKEAVIVRMAALSQWKYNERLTDITRRVAAPDFPASVTSASIHEGLMEVGDPCEAALHYPDGVALHMLAEGQECRRMFPFVQLYTMPDRPFFCVEPWMGFPNAMNSMGSVRWIQPGCVENATLSVWTVNP